MAPVFPSDAGLAAFGLAIDRVRFVVVRPSAPPDTVADTTVALPPDARVLDLNLRVPIVSSPETVLVSIVALAGAVPLFEGTAPVAVSAGLVAEPTEVPVTTYVGPGAGVDSIAISPRTSFIYFGDSLRFQVQAFQGGAPVPQFYVSWSTSDTALAHINGLGSLRAPASRSNVWVIGRTPGAIADSVTATFQPVPAQLVVIAGASQTGPVSLPLATQLEVEVRGADNLPVFGVAVRFRSLSGGIPNDTTVMSDLAGRASVIGVLGPTPGPQTFQATIPAFPGVTAAAFNATATGVVISPAMSIVTVTSGSVLSGNSVKLRLQGKDAAGNDITTGGAVVVFTRSGGTSTGRISATADSGNGVYTAVFTGVVAGTATTIGATINGAPVTATPLPTIAVSPGAISPATSVITASSGTVASGSAVTLRLEAKDAAGNSLTTGGDTVAFGFSGGTSTGTISAVADSGNGVYAATFTGVLAGAATSIDATINGSPVKTLKPAVAVTPGAPAQLVFVAAPSFAATGVVISPAVVVAARDLAGNATPGYGGDVTIAIGTNPGAGSLAGTLTQTAGGGVATFGDLAIDLPGIGYTLTATAAGLAGATTASFDVVPPAGTIFWAVAANGNWSNPANWVGGVVPGPTETAAITVPGTYTVTLDVSDTIGGLQLGGSSGAQTLLAASKTLHVSGTTQVNANGLLDFRASTLGGGTLSNSGTVLVTGSATINPGVVTAPTSLIRVQGNGSYGLGALSVTSSFTNNGAIVLTDTTSSYGATLSMPAGATLTNGPGGTINAAVGAAGPRTLALALDNHGTVTLDRGLTLNRASASHANSGTINVAGGDFTVTQSGTGPTFTTSGAIAIGAGHAMQLTGGAFDYAAGTIVGPGTLALTNVTATITPALNTGSVPLSLTNSIVGGGGSVTIATSTALDVRSSTVNLSFVNQGLLTMTGSSALNAAVTNSTGATLRVQGNGTYGLATLTVATSFTNNGAIVLTDTTSSYGATLSMPAGATLTNAAGGRIDAAVGLAGPRTLALALDNQGIVTLNRPLTINGAGATHTNNGTIDVSGGDLTLTQSGIGPSFTTAGTITIGSGRTFAVNGGAFKYTSGTISGGTLSVSGTAVTSAQPFNTATAALTLISSTWGGSGTITVSGATALDVRASTITAPLVNQATIRATGSSAFNGGLVNPAGSTLTVQGNGTYGLATLTVGTSFTNGGAIVLTDTTSAYGATLSMAAGVTLTNAPSGTIIAATGFGGARTLALTLDNQGTVTLDRPLTLNRAAADHLNSGTIDVSGGDFTLSQSGATPSFATSGSIAIGPGRTFSVSGGAFDYTAGSISGGGTFALSSTTVTAAQSFSTATAALSLASSTWGGTGTLTVASGTSLLVRASTINSALLNKGLLVVNGASAFNGSVTNPAGATLRVQGNGIYGVGSLSIATAFTNAGTIELTDTTSSYGATLSVSLTQPFINAAGGTIAALQGFNGHRFIFAQLDNQGTVSVATAPNQPLTLAAGGVSHQNSGTIVITSGNLLISGPGESFTNTGAISVGAGDTLRMTNGSFTHNGGTLGGAGALSLESVTTGAFNVAQSIASMLFTNSTASFATPQSTGATGFQFSSSTINGPGLLTNDLGRFPNVQSSTINADLDNHGTLLVNGSSAFNGVLTTGDTSLIQVQGNGTYGTGTMTVLNGFTNRGVIELSDIVSSYGATLNVTNGTLTNSAGASINALAGTNGARTLAAELDNQGAIAVALAPNSTLSVNRPASVHMNSGTIDVSGGDLTVSGASSFTNVGAMTIGGGDTLTISGGSFTYGGGTLDGPGTLVLAGVNPANFAKPHTLGSMIMSSSTASFASDQSTGTTDFLLTSSALNGPGTLTNVPGKTLNIRSSGIAAPFINQGTLLANGTSTIDGPLTTVAGSTVRVQGNGTYSTGTLTVNNGMINNGAIELTDTTLGYGATLVVKGLPLVNAGTIDIQPGFGGPRTIDAVLDNQGTFTGNQSVTIGHADAAHTNRGTMKVKAGAITFAQSGTNESFMNLAGGIIDIDAGTVFRVSNGPVTNTLGGKIVGFGTLAVRAPATFSNDGEIIPGGSPGTLTIDGNMLIPGTGIVTIELGGPTAGKDYDQLVITGTAIFAEGTLNVSTIGAFDPKGLSFDVMTFGPGSFTGLPRNFTVPAGCDPQPVNTGTSIRVVCP